MLRKYIHLSHRFVCIEYIKKIYWNNNAVKIRNSVLLILNKDAECMSRLVYVSYDAYHIFYGRYIHLNLNLSLRSLVIIVGSIRWRLEVGNGFSFFLLFSYYSINYSFEGFVFFVRNVSFFVEAKKYRFNKIRKLIYRCVLILISTST